MLKACRVVTGKSLVEVESTYLPVEPESRSLGFALWGVDVPYIYDDGNMHSGTVAVLKAYFDDVADEALLRLEAVASLRSWQCGPRNWDH
eukprot:3227756-Amphidinium_carterae.1